MSNFNNQGYSGEGRHHDGGAFGNTNTRDSGYNSGVSGGSGYDNPSSTNAGPHNSNLLNKADPRVDSDRDGRTGTGNTTGAGLGGNTPGTSYGSGTHSGYGSNTNTHDNPRSTNQGPHNSNALNKADPRVDSDRDGRTGTGHTTGSGYGNNTTGSGYGNTGSGYGGSHTGSNTGSGYGNTGSNTNNPNYDNPQSTNQGPHGSNIANKLDPVSSAVEVSLFFPPLTCCSASTPTVIKAPALVVVMGQVPEVASVAETQMKNKIRSPHLQRDTATVGLAPQAQDHTKVVWATFLIRELILTTAVQELAVDPPQRMLPSPVPVRLVPLKVKPLHLAQHLPMQTPRRTQSKVQSTR